MAAAMPSEESTINAAVTALEVLRRAVPQTFAEAVQRFGHLTCEPAAYDSMSTAEQAIFLIECLRAQRDSERAFTSQLREHARERTAEIWDGTERRQGDRRLH